MHDGGTVSRERRPPTANERHSTHGRPAHALGSAAAGRRSSARRDEAAEEDAVTPFDLIGNHLSGIELKPQGVEDNRVRDFQELHRERQQFVARQAAMAFIKSFGQGKRDPGRAWIMAVFSMPSFIATASAVLKPMPRMSRASL